VDLKPTRVAIVTGGAGGIGIHTAQRFLDSGYHVALWDNDANALDTGASLLHPKAVLNVVVDVTDPASVGNATSLTLATFGRLDVLVNSAGITGPNETTWEYPIDAWERVIKINLTGTFLCCRSVIPHMIRQAYGRIVNIASMAGKEGNARAPAYSASKAGVIGLTKSLGKELAEQGVLVNCICPAAVETEIFQQMTPEFV
jgi:3-oxoacyl-[acyl-carrier protein] reductase